MGRRRGAGTACARREPNARAVSIFFGPWGHAVSDRATPLAAAAEQAAARGVDAEAANQEFFAHFPGLAELMEPDNPGMHASHTVDYGVVLSGEVDLELDDRVVKRLKAGDCYVQNGTRHAWQNPGDVDCVIAAIAVGARARR